MEKVVWPPWGKLGCISALFSLLAFKLWQEGYRPQEVYNRARAQGSHAVPETL